ncbi:Mg-chelatase subunit ChlD [Bradyrhizobium sp. LM3.6]
MLALTSTFSTVKSTIEAMVANGGTNQTIGLHWGWLSLLRQSPLNAPAEDVNNQYQHVIILFTDGQNTVNRWNGDGSNEHVLDRARKDRYADGDAVRRGQGQEHHDLRRSA